MDANLLHCITRETRGPGALMVCMLCFDLLPGETNIIALLAMSDSQKDNRLNLYFPPDYHTFHKLWLKLNENCETSSHLSITLEIIQSAPNDPKLN